MCMCARACAYARVCVWNTCVPCACAHVCVPCGWGVGVMCGCTVGGCVGVPCGYVCRCVLHGWVCVVRVWMCGAVYGWMGVCGCIIWACTSCGSVLYALCESVHPCGGVFCDYHVWLRVWLRVWLLCVITVCNYHMYRAQMLWKIWIYYYLFCMLLK